MDKLRQSETEVEKDGSQHDVCGGVRSLFILLSLVSCHLGCLGGALPVLSVFMSAWLGMHFLSLYGCSSQALQVSHASFATIDITLISQAGHGFIFFSAWRPHHISLLLLSSS